MHPGAEQHRDVDDVRGENNTRETFRARARRRRREVTSLTCLRSSKWSSRSSSSRQRAAAAAAAVVALGHRHGPGCQRKNREKRTVPEDSSDATSPWRSRHSVAASLSHWMRAMEGSVRRSLTRRDPLAGSLARRAGRLYLDRHLRSTGVKESVAKHTPCTSTPSRTARIGKGVFTCLFFLFLVFITAGEERRERGTRFPFSVVVLIPSAPPECAACGHPFVP